MELNSHAGLLNARPPGLEDAGLEDCALPAHAIQEAFNRAADVLQNVQHRVQSAAFGSFGTSQVEGINVGKNPGLSSGLWEDSCVNLEGSALLGGKQSCVDTKAGVVAKGADHVVTPGIGEGDKVVFGNESGPKLGDDQCVEGLPGDRGEKKVSSDETKEGPILVLA